MVTRLKRPTGRRPFARRGSVAVHGNSRTVEIQFSENALKAVKRLAQDTDRSFSQVLSDAIALEDWASRVQHDGGKILAKRGNDVRELVRE